MKSLFDTAPHSTLCSYLSMGSFTSQLTPAQHVDNMCMYELLHCVPPGKMLDEASMLTLSWCMKKFDMPTCVKYLKRH